jgi:hypothetical protein
MVAAATNRLVWAALVTLAVVQWAAASWTPLAGLLGSMPLGAADWMTVAVAVTWPVALLEGLKRWRMR